MVDRVRRPKDFDELLKTLTDDKEKKVFETYKDCLVFCASLCASKGKEYKRGFKETSEPIKIHIFNGKYDAAFINALAIFDTNDAMVISSERQDERIKIFEDYACGGLHILDSELMNAYVSYDKHIINIINKITQKKDIIEDITNL